MKKTSKKLTTIALSIIMALAVMASAVTAYAASEHTNDHDSIELKASRKDQIITTQLETKKDLSIGGIGLVYSFDKQATLESFDLVSNVNNKVFNGGNAWNEAIRMLGVTRSDPKPVDAGTWLVRFENKLTKDFQYDHEYTFSVTMDEAYGNGDVLKNYDWNNDTFKVTYAEWTVTFTAPYADSSWKDTVQHIVNNEKATVPAAPTRTGYTFDGWKVTKGSATASGAETSAITKTTTFEAQWKANQYTITFDTDGGSKIDPITQDYGTAVTAPADPTKEGYTFDGWEPALPTEMPAENTTVKAKWTPKQYTIKYDSDGGTDVKDQTYNFGATVTAPTDPTKTGYTFKGWEPELPKTMPAKDLEVKAQWETNQYTITFNTDGGSAINPITQDYGTAVTAPANPTKDGCTFAGWDKTIPANMPAENMTITAKWTANKYTITWKNDDGTVLKTEEVEHGTTPAYTGETPAKTDPAGQYTYTFKGWTPEIVPATADETYTAQFDQTLKGYHIYVVDYTDGKATTSIDEAKFYSGEVSFTVTADKATVIAQFTDATEETKKSQTGTYERMYCTESNDIHTFTLTMTDHDVYQVMGYKGDVEVNGDVGLKDSTVMSQIYVQNKKANALQTLFGDIDVDNAIKLKDSTLASRAFVGTYTCLWDIAQ